MIILIINDNEINPVCIYPFELVSIRIEYNTDSI